MSKAPHRSYHRFPLDRILGNLGNVRVLRALFSYGGPLSVTQLAGEIGMTPQGVRLVLDSLVSAGVVEVLGQGRSQLYSCKGDHPWAPPLQSLFRTEKSQWEEMLTQIRELLEVNDRITEAWLYGSVARGEDNPRSDVDLALLLLQGTDENPIRESFEDFERKRHMKVSLVCVTKEDLRTEKVSSVWWGNVLREGKQLKGRTRQAPTAGPKTSRHAGT